MLKVMSTVLFYQHPLTSFDFYHGPTAVTLSHDTFFIHIQRSTALTNQISGSYNVDRTSATVTKTHQSSFD